MSKEIYTKSELQEIAEKYEYCITGSDQVWSPISAGFDEMYFLPGLDKRRKFSYAASIGATDVSEEIKQQLKQRLADYSVISVREESAKKLLWDSYDPGDITIADYWGIERAALEFDDNKGVSLVLINNQNGENEFEKVKDRVKWKQTKIEDSMQPALIKPFERPENREKFWQDFENDTFDSIAKEYGGYTFFNKIKYKLKKEKQRLMKR